MVQQRAMDRAVMYHVAEPNNFKQSYEEYDQVDFTLSNEGRSLMMGSVRVEGVWAVSQQGEPFGESNTSFDDLVYYDRFVGAHAVCEQITTETLNLGILETISHYPRMVKVVNSGQGSQTTQVNSINGVELRVPVLELTRETLMGEYLAGDPGDVNIRRTDPDFSFKPMCILNNTTGLMPYRKSGDIRLTLNIARYAEALFGVNASQANTSYVLKELRCVWRSAPDDGSNPPIRLLRHLSLKQSIQSSFAALQLRVPAVCSSMYASFQPQDEEGEFAPNSQALARPPGVTLAEFLFNDATNRVITYQLRTELERAEALRDAITAGFVSSSAITLRNLISGDTYGIGLRFGQPLDLNRQKLTLNLTSEISNADAYVMYAFFPSEIQM